MAFDVAREAADIVDDDHDHCAVLRRAGIVERWSEDHWKVPQDLADAG